MSRTLSFSKRTVAIALAASVATSGVYAVAPASHSPFGAAVALAAESEHITNDAVTFVGLFDANGKVDGNVHTNRIKSDSSFPVLNTPARFEFEIDIANAAPGDVVTLTPVTHYSHPRSGANRSTPEHGLRFSNSQSNVPLSIDGTQVASLDVTATKDATITFLPAVDQFATGKIKAQMPAEFGIIYLGDSGLGQSASAQAVDANWEVQVKTTGSNNEVKKLGERAIVTSANSESSYIVRTDVYNGTDGTVVKDDGTVDILRLDQRLLYGQDSKVVLSPAAGTAPSGNDYLPWAFNPEVKPIVTLWEFDDDGTYVKRIDEPSEVAKLGVTYDAKFDSGQWTVVVHGVTGTKYKPVVRLASKSPAVGFSEFEEGRELGLTADITPIDPDGNPVQVPANSFNVKPQTVTHRFREFPGIADGAGTGEAKVRTLEANAFVKDAPEGTGLTSPARIAGQNRTFVFDLKNTGNAAVRKVTITPQVGEPKTFDVDIKPGETSKVELPYDVPGNATEVVFSVSAALGTVAPDSFTFKIDQSTTVDKNDDGTYTITDPQGNEIIAVTKEEFDKVTQELEKANKETKDELEKTKKDLEETKRQLEETQDDLEKTKQELDRVNEELKKVNDRLTALENKQDVYVVDGRRNPDNSITLIRNDGGEIHIPAANKLGLERCLAQPGGGLLALIPILGLLTAGLTQLNVDAINESMINAQKQAGVYNADVANFVYDNRGPLGALLGTLLGSLVLFIPGTCGELSLAQAIGESLKRGEGSSGSSNVEQPAAPAPTNP